MEKSNEKFERPAVRYDPGSCVLASFPCPISFVLCVSLVSFRSVFSQAARFSYTDRSISYRQGRGRTRRSPLSGSADGGSEGGWRVGAVAEERRGDGAYPNPGLHLFTFRKLRGSSRVT